MPGSSKTARFNALRDRSAHADFECDSGEERDPLGGVDRRTLPAMRRTLPQFSVIIMRMGPYSRSSPNQKSRNAGGAMLSQAIAP